MLKRTVFFWLIALASMSANAAGVSAEQVLSRSCSTTKPGDKDYCPYPFDLLRTDSKFARSFKQFKEAANVDGLDGPQTPLTPVQVWGTKYLKSTGCEKHNCGANYYIFMYQPRTARMVGIHRIVDGGGTERYIWLNNPLFEAEKDVLMSLMAEEFKRN